MRTAVLYAYFKTPIADVNLSYFLVNGLVGDTDYVFVQNGAGKPNAALPEHWLQIERSNEGFDFGAWATALERIDLESYDRFVFLNCTARGPFLPRYVDRDWIRLFCGALDDHTKLVGPTVNYRRPQQRPLMQSHAFGTDREGLDVIMRAGIFDVPADIDKVTLVERHEVRMSEVVLNAGFGVYAFQLSENAFGGLHEDVHYEGSYFGITLNPVEIMFVKTNRINNQVVERYTTWGCHTGE